MPIFRLEPLATGLGDPAWAASRSCGTCYIAAQDANAARRLACGLFTLAARPPGMLLQGLVEQPWLLPHLVAVSEVAALELVSDVPSLERLH